MLAELLTTELFVFLLLFLRIGTALMVLPGFGERYVPTFIRLPIALGVTLALAPVLAPSIPPMPDSPFALLLLIGGEIGIGLLIGGLARLMTSALHVAGTVIAFKSGLAYALTMDPSQGVQGALIASFLSILGVVVIFSLNLHFLMLRGVADSYVLFVPGQLPPIGDFADLAVRVVAGSFALGIQLAAPFIVYAMIFNISLGVMARLMPSLPIFFVVMPLQIWVAFGMLGVTIAVIVEFFAGYFESQIVELLILQ